MNGENKEVLLMRSFSRVIQYLPGWGKLLALHIQCSSEHSTRWMPCWRPGNGGRLSQNTGTPRTLQSGSRKIPVIAIRTCSKSRLRFLMKVSCAYIRWMSGMNYGSKKVSTIHSVPIRIMKKYLSNCKCLTSPWSGKATNHSQLRHPRHLACHSGPALASRVSLPACDLKRLCPPKPNLTSKE